MEQARRIAVFGGTGFLGTQIVRCLRERGFAVRVATRHPGKPEPGIEAVRADIADAASVTAALAGCDGAVNAVSQYVEAGQRTFRAVHVEAAALLARIARDTGLRQLVHVSGIGADAASTSTYISSRGQGEQAVQAAFPSAVVFRPAVLFGPGDAFLTVLATLLRRTPVFALFGEGRTLLQPAYVGDVARAVAERLGGRHEGGVYELGGPDVLSYRALVEKIAMRLGRRRVLLPVPFVLWHAAAAVAELLPGAPLTRNQVELMRIDSVASAQLPGFGALGITPRSIDEILPQVLVAGGG